MPRAHSKQAVRRGLNSRPSTLQPGLVTVCCYKRETVNIPDKDLGPNYCPPSPSGTVMSHTRDSVSTVERRGKFLQLHRHEFPLTTRAQSLHSRAPSWTGRDPGNLSQLPAGNTGAGKVDILPIITMMIITVMITTHTRRSLLLCCALLSAPPMNAHI